MGHHSLTSLLSLVELPVQLQKLMGASSLESSSGHCGLGGPGDLATGHEFIFRKEPLANGETEVKDSVSE